MATIEVTISAQWTCNRGYNHDCDVEVVYDYDGVDDLQIRSAISVGDPIGIGSRDFDDLVDEIIFERAPADYADWLADQEGIDD